MDSSGDTHLLSTFNSTVLVVLSIDLICTFAFGVIGELVCFKGLKFNTAVMILLAAFGRVRIKVPRQFRVALTKMASLQALSGEGHACLRLWDVPRFLMKDVEQPVQ